MADVKLDDPTIYADSVSLTDRVGVSQGDGRPKTATLEQILGLVTLGGGDPWVVYVDDFTGTDQQKLYAAIAVVPDGGVVKLSNRIYNVNWVFADGYITKDNFTIEGTKTPTFKADGTGLENGTIITGTLAIVDSSNLVIRNLGVDCGSSVCDTYFAGAAQEGFILANSNHNPVSANKNKNILVENIVAIVKDASAAVHCFLFECVESSIARNIKARNGVHTFVIKATNSFVEKVDIQGSGGNGMYILNGDYALCGNLTVKDVSIKDGAGLHVYAYLAPISNVFLQNFNIRDITNNGVHVQADYALTNLHISDFTVDTVGAAAACLSVAGGDVYIESSVLKNSTYGIWNGGGSVAADLMKYSGNGTDVYGTVGTRITASGANPFAALPNDNNIYVWRNGTCEVLAIS